MASPYRPLVQRNSKTKVLQAVTGFGGRNAFSKGEGCGHYTKLSSLVFYSLKLSTIYFAR